MKDIYYNVLLFNIVGWRVFIFINRKKDNDITDLKMDQNLKIRQLKMQFEREINDLKEEHEV